MTILVKFLAWTTIIVVLVIWAQAIACRIAYQNSCNKDSVMAKNSLIYMPMAIAFLAVLPFILSIVLIVQKSTPKFFTGQ